MALNKKRKDDDGERPDDAGRRHRGPVRVDASDQRACAPRHGHGAGRGGQREREQEFVECRDHCEDRGRGESGRGEGKRDPDRGTPSAGRSPSTIAASSRSTGISWKKLSIIQTQKVMLKAV